MDRLVGPRAAVSRAGVRVDPSRVAIRSSWTAGTTFHFVTEGFDAAYSAACETAGESGVDIAGGASTVRQALLAGVIDELTLDIAPVLLGSGERIFDDAWAAASPPRRLPSPSRTADSRCTAPLTTRVR